MTFNADMTCQSTVTASGGATLNYPAACVTVDGTPIACDQLDEAPADGGTSSATCSAAGCGGCSCSVALHPRVHQSLGTYSINGNSVTISWNGQLSAAAADYCVQGGRLAVNLSSTSSTLTGHVVLAKE